jgi:uncharacterized protein
MGPADKSLRVSVIYSPGEDRVHEVSLAMAPAATVGDAVRESGLVERHGLDLGQLSVGVWGRIQPLDQGLRDRDRVELCRALQVDPKEARRLRYRKQAKKSDRPA